ncbi:methyltransferase domain-containing protein [Streptomyces triculaminicus]|uniref:class I SAM-dependent methyltransferase n=1 Tax=Streptomyces triculaminicus TaxID=2816232 RepID=UPI0033F23C3D
MHPRYRHAASIYDKAFPVFSFGAGPRIHQMVAQAVPVQPGATVVDIGCGTGLMLAMLRERVGPQGKVIGIDMTEPMLDRARRRVAGEGWKNVELYRADMTGFDPGIAVDAVVFALSLSAARPAEVFHRTLRYLRPGGSMVIADGIPAHGRWYHPAVNLYARFRAPLVGSDLGRAAEIARLAHEHLVDVRTNVIWAGLYTIVSGRAPSEGDRHVGS